ncbi:hypothetical protein N752_06495 [Desulforamulus aquiferis]|nr:hypothetical protein N752_06495 [Desulforamulus aquiferis]
MQPGSNIGLEAEKFVNPELGVATVDEALQGAMDIIAEMVSDNPETRGWVRQFTYNRESW